MGVRYLSTVHRLQNLDWRRSIRRGWSGPIATTAPGRAFLVSCVELAQDPTRPWSVCWSWTRGSGRWSRTGGAPASSRPQQVDITEW